MDSYKEYEKAVARVFNSSDGKFLLKFWMEEYVYPTAVADSAERTYYNLGQREWILGLVKSMEDPNDLKSY